MSGGVFGHDYAAAYDDLYGDKNYDAECDVVERAFMRYGLGRVRRVLDLGCGTGGHVVPLAQRGYEVVGVDRAPDMLERARNLGSSARFVLGDITSTDLGEAFDAVLMMFAVLGYQVTNGDVLAALRTTRRHLQPGGLLFCDLWYGPAVLAERPSDRVKIVETPTSQLIRAATGELDSRRDVCTVRYHVWRIDDGRLSTDVREEHPMRYFFGPELELLLSTAGLELVRLGAFPVFEDEPSERTWNVALVARAV